MKNVLRNLLVFGFIIGLAFTGNAFRADLPLGALPKPNPAKAKLRAKSAQKAPTKARKAAAESITDAQIVWDAKTGAPGSIRTVNLQTVKLGGKGIKLKADASYNQRAIDVLDRLSSAYGIKDAASEFTAYQVRTDDMNYNHVRIKQRYKGLIVFGADLIVHFNANGTAYQVNGRYVPDIAVDTTPVLKADQALAIAQADLAQNKQPAGKLLKDPELVIFAHNGATPRLAYQLTFVDPKPASWLYWIDAENGQVLLSYNNLQSAGSATTVSGKILSGEGGGSVSITGWLESSRYYLYNPTLRYIIRNADTTGSFYDSGYQAQRTTSGWGASDRIEVSAANNFANVMRYFDGYWGWQGYDDAGSVAIAYVHYKYGSDYNNAYWDGNNKYFLFLDGDNSSFAGLTTLDICGHEFGHAVDQYSGNLTYAGEPGGLNESFSDCMGALVEFYYQPDGRYSYPNRTAGKSDWLLGEDSTYVSSSTALRDMRNPSRFNQPSRYHGTGWWDTDDTSSGNDYGGVHYNSGVHNFMFYLLCEGGSGNNDGISYNVTGIGIAAGGAVCKRTLLTYITSSTDFAACKTAWLSAAADVNSAYVSSVEAAWDAVYFTGGGGANPNAYLAYAWAYNGYYYAYLADYYYWPYDYYHYLYYAYSYSYYGYLYAYYAYYYDYYYGDDYGYAYYAYYYTYYGYLYADAAYTYSTGDVYSYYAAYYNYYASIYAYYVYINYYGISNLKSPAAIDTAKIAVE